MSQRTKTKVDTSLAFQYHWFVWKFFGLMPPEHESKWFKPYIAYAIILNLSILSLPASLLINLILSKNITELCENICNTTTDLTCSIKFFYILFVRQKLLKVRNILEPLDARATARKEVAILEEGISSARKLFVVFARLCICFFVTSQIIVFFSSERILMYPAWFPWDWKASKRNFLYAHSSQFYCGILQTTQNIVNDTFPPAYLIMLSAQIKALAARIQDLGSNSASSEGTLYSELANCIKDHHNITKLFQNIQEILSTTCLVQFAATGVAQCTMGVYMLYVGSDPTKLLHLFFFFAAITTEILILCYYGDLYCQANVHLTESIYACNWMDRDKKFKKAILFLLQRSQMSSTIMAGNLIPVGMPTFVKIVKTAYSVFTVLNNAK